MLLSTDYCKVYKNGNVTIKYDKDKIAESIIDDILTISEVLDWIDCLFVGDSYCLSNYEMGHTVYNVCLDVIYVFPWRFLEDLKAGKMVRLYAKKPDKWDRELLEDLLGDNGYFA